MDHSIADAWLLEDTDLFDDPEEFEPLGDGNRRKATPRYDESL